MYKARRMRTLPTFDMRTRWSTELPDWCFRGSNPAWATHWRTVMVSGSTPSSGHKRTALFSAMPRTEVNNVKASCSALWDCLVGLDDAKRLTKHLVDPAA
jgi:hypothetical protein